MRVVPAQDKTALVGLYVQEKTGCQYDPDMFQAMAILDDSNNFVGGVIFSEYRGYDCQLSCAAETPLAWRDAVLHAVFDYVFNQLKCVRCTALTKKANRKARAFLEGLGFQLEGRIRHGYDGIKDALIYGMLREECVYIQEVDSGNVEAESDTPAADAAPLARPEEAAATQLNHTARGSERKETLSFW